MVVQWSHLPVRLCLFNRHAPVRAEAQWDGEQYTGTCRHCGEAILRKDRGVWKKQKTRLA